MRVPDEPMLTASTNTTAVPAGMVAEPKWDGIRAFLARHADGSALIRSRNGTDLTTAFPELAAAVEALPPREGEVLFDGEIVLWHQGRLAFEKLLTRINRKPSSARRLARELPASFVAFDLLHHRGHSWIDEPYARRRSALVTLFEHLELAPPWTLCPASTDPGEIAEWLRVWPALGIEGICLKRPDQVYEPGRRGWLKYRLRESTEAIIGAITGRIEAPSSVLLGRFDAVGRLRYVARSVPLSRTVAAEIGQLLAPADASHPWHTRKPSPRWNAAEPGEIVLVQPMLVAEFSGDLAQDERGVFRHLVRFVRPRPDLAPGDAPSAAARRESSAE